LFNNAPLGYQSLDFGGNFIEVNQQWLDTLGYEREEVIGKWFGDFLTPAYQDGFRKRFPIFKAQGHIHSEFEMVHKNGSVLFIAFDGKIGYDLNGNFKQTHCILQDITKARLAQRKQTP
jgi:PAS domain S-box-containing protein